jgi:TRAP-type transport system periplasmic protein
MASAPRSRQTAAIAVAIAAVATLTIGCSADHATKAGKAEGPVVLKMANTSADLTYEPGVAYFVERVRQLSHGTVRIAVVNGWGNYQPDAEQRVVRDVANGTADLAWVGTRVFDTFGLRTFRALTAPMLIDSYPLQRAVLASDLPARMLPSLGGLHVKGLAILADGLRKPISAGRPLLGPADWRGRTFATFRSRGQEAAIRALAAKPIEAWSTTLADGLDDGTIRGFEKNLLVYRINQLQQWAPFVTANVNLWPQTVALLVDPGRLSALSADQRLSIQRAAADAATRSTVLADRDESLVAPLCAAGARFATATTADLRALERAFAPVYRRLELDATTERFIAEIEQLKSSTPAGPPLTIPARCAAASPSATATATAVGRKQQPDAINGVYRIAWTRAQLLADGARQGYARGNQGVITLTLDDGRFLLHDAGPPIFNCAGRYRVDAETFSIDFNVPTCKGGQGIVIAHWSRRPNGDLRFHVREATDVGDEILWGRKPWTRIG